MGPLKQISLKKKGADDPIDPDLDHRPCRDLLSEAHIGLINRWRNDCETGHESCNKTSCNQPLPNRVLEILDLNDKTQGVRLVETRGETRGAYACLSYCWGDSDAQIGQTTRDKLSGYLRGMPFGDLPSTVIDAIRLAYKLGFRFLWVDRLCIVQDDREDWANESSRMCEVYSRSALTISVPICKESSQSFLAERRRGFREQSRFVTVTHNEGGSKLRSASWFSYADMSHDGPWVLENSWETMKHRVNHEDNRWMLRGWTFQEWMLSPRVLHIDSMTTWDCFEGYANEINRRYMEGAKLVRNPTQLGRGLSWESIVNEYSNRELAFAEDKLPALAGLAARYSQVTGHTYLAGLWREDLPWSLLWVRRGARPTERAPDQRMPSWSWASRIGSIEYIWDFKDCTARVSVSSAFCQYHPPNSLTTVEKAWIDVDGRVSHITDPSPVGMSVMAGDDLWSTCLDHDVFPDDAIAQASVYLLLVGSGRSNRRCHYALVLQECGWEDGRQCFQRLGYARTDGWEHGSRLTDLGPSWELRTIRLV